MNELMPVCLLGRDRCIPTDQPQHDGVRSGASSSHF